MSACLKNLKRFVLSLGSLRALVCKRFDGRYNRRFDRDLEIREINQSFPSRNDKYLYCHHYFRNLAPEWLRTHRKYFSESNRGFGEDAFHAMWYLLFREFTPKSVLEIGVYRGQVISLWAMLSKHFGLKTEIHGISPFTPHGDAVSNYRDGLDYFEDTLANFSHFGLESPILHRGFSSDTGMRKIIESRKWDLIYIDGNHDYDVALGDILTSAGTLVRGGLMVLDDAALYTTYAPFLYSSAGHPGPSRIANELDSKMFGEILSVGHNRVFRKAA